MNSFLDKIISSNRNILICLFLVGLAAFAVILPTHFKTMDDLVSIVNNPRIKSIGQIGQIFTTSFFMENAYYRPMVLLSYLIEFQLFGLKAFFYNLNNVILHILNAFFSFRIIECILKNRKLAFMSGVMYLIHPVHWEAVSNIPGRSIVLCSLFFLISFFYFLKQYEDVSSKKPLILSIIFFVLALLTKESAIMLPFCMAAYIFFIGDKKGSNPYMGLWPYVVCAGVYMVLRRVLGITEVSTWDSPFETILAVATFLKACVYFVGQIVLPINFYYDHTTTLYTSLGDIGLWVVVGIWVGVFYKIVQNKDKIPPAILFFMSWIVINFVTVSQIVPIRAPGGKISTADHFLYMPVLGAIVLIVYAVNEWVIKKGFLKPSIQSILVGGYCLFLFITLLQQNVYATNQIAMFSRTLQQDPGNVRVRNSLAVCFAYAGKFEEAEVHYKETLKYEPYNTDALIGAGKALSDQGKYQQALEYYHSVRDPRAYEGVYAENLVFVYKKLIEYYELSGQSEQVESLQEALKMINSTKH